MNTSIFFLDHIRCFGLESSFRNMGIESIWNFMVIFDVELLTGWCWWISWGFDLDFMGNVDAFFRSNDFSFVCESWTKKNGWYSKNNWRKHSINVLIMELRLDHKRTYIFLLAFSEKQLEWNKTHSGSYQYGTADICAAHWRPTSRPLMFIVWWQQIGPTGEFFAGPFKGNLRICRNQTNQLGFPIDSPHGRPPIGKISANPSFVVHDFET